MLCQPPPPRVGSDVSHAAAHRGNKACCALPDACRLPSRRPPPASLSSCAEYARRLLRIECVVLESCCAGAEPDTWELQKLVLQDANSPNIIWPQFHNFKTRRNKSWRHLQALLLLLFCARQLDVCRVRHAPAAHNQRNRHTPAREKQPLTSSAPPVRGNACSARWNNWEYWACHTSHVTRCSWQVASHLFCESVSIIISSEQKPSFMQHKSINLK